MAGIPPTLPAALDDRNDLLAVPVAERHLGAEQIRAADVAPAQVGAMAAGTADAVERLAALDPRRVFGRALLSRNEAAAALARAGSWAVIARPMTATAERAFLTCMVVPFGILVELRIVRRNGRRVIRSLSHMKPVNRRQFGSAVACLAGRTYGASAEARPRSTMFLREGIVRRKIPAAVGMAADGAKVLYQGAFGTRDSSGVPVKIDSIFQIASMTKAITTTAALQLVEQGRCNSTNRCPGIFRSSPNWTCWRASMPQGKAKAAARQNADHAAPPAHAYLRILLRHLGRRTVPLLDGDGRADGGKHRSAGIRAGLALAIRTGSRLGGTAGGEAQRHESRGVFSGEDPAAARNAGYELHPARGEVRPSGHRLRAPAGWIAQTEQSHTARAAQGVQWRRRPVLDRRRLRALHADDPGQGPGREPGADPAGEDGRGNGNESDRGFDGRKDEKLPSALLPAMWTFSPASPRNGDSVS